MKYVLAICVCLMIGCGEQPGHSVAEAAKEFEEIKALAEKGDAEAQYQMASIYGRGEGVEKDFKEAAKWHRKAADQGFAMAQRNLGAIYYRGDGVLKDYVTSEAWYNIARHNGDGIAMKVKNLKATSEQITEAQKLSREMIAKNPKLINNK